MIDYIENIREWQQDNEPEWYLPTVEEWKKQDEAEILESLKDEYAP